MDLRPINPYYRIQPATGGRARAARAQRAAPYSYPYTWIEPVTDRTQEDVSMAREISRLEWKNMTAGQKEAYLAGFKGCMNRADFERIENDIQILIDVLELENESHVGAVPEFPTDAYFRDMETNVAAIREAYTVHADTPPVPVRPYNTWQKYNDIEQIIADVHEVLSAQFHYYAGGEIYAGDVTGLLL